jgi:uracil-DNA glycosylase family 4
MELQFRQEHDRPCCPGCTLHPQETGNFTWFTPTEVDGPVDIYFAFEAPGEQEDRYVDQFTKTRGRPVVGPAGQMHRSCMQDAGIFGNYALGNVCKCRPMHNKTPTPAQVNQCVPYMLEEIQRLQPKVVVCCGGTAIKALMPEIAGHGVLKSLGRIVERDGVTYIANFHPSFINRQQDEKSRAYRKEQYTNVLKTATKIVKDDPTADWLKPGFYFYADTVDKVKSVVDMYLTEPAVEGILAFDTETMDGLNRFTNRVSVLQFCHDGEMTVLIPFQHPEAPWTPDEIEQIKAEIVRLFTTPTETFQWIVGNYLKFDLAMLRTCIHPDLGTARLPIHASLLDTMFLAHAVDEQRLKRIPKHEKPMSLERIARDFIGWTGFEDNGLKKERDEFGKKSLFDEAFREYCAMDGYVPHRTARALLALADQEGGGRERVLRFNKHLHGPLICVFEAIERNGFCVDVEHLRYLCGPQSPIKTRMAEIQAELKTLPEVQKANEVHLQKTKAAGMTTLFGPPWVLDIDKKDCQLTLFIDVLGLEPLGFGKPKIGPRGEEIPQPKIDTFFFERYRSSDDLPDDEEITPTQHIIDLVYEYKGLYKLDTSYTKSVFGRIHNEGPNGECVDGRMRSSFTSCRVTSGRTSSEGVNLQQVPGKGRLAATVAARKAVKNMYCVDKGRLLVQMDVAQSEVRHIVGMAMDKNYAKVFWNMEKIKAEFIANPTPENKQRVKFECDIHRQTAALMNQIPIEEVTPIQRQAAKRIVFGILYGQHITTLAKNLGITVEKAQELLDIFFGQFPKVKEWLDWAVSYARANGFIDSPMGRRRHLAWAYNSDDRAQANRADRQAKNSPIQVISSDYNLLAGIRLQRYIEENNLDWRIVNLVHDSIIADIPYDEAVLREYIETAERIFTDTSCLKEMFGIELIVPLAVDFDIGFKYGDCKGFDRSEKNFQEIWAWLEAQVAAGTAWPKAATKVWN